MSTSPLARLGLGLLLVTTLVLFAGCVKQKEEATVTKSGAGTAKMTATLDLSNVKEMREMLAGMGMGNPEDVEKDPAEELDVEEFKKKAENAKGVRVTSAKREIAEDKSSATMLIELEFDSLQLLYESGLIEGVEVSLVKHADGNYELRRSMFANMIPAGGGGDAESAEAAAMMEMMLGMFQPYMTGMELKTVLTLPTAIIETSGEQGTGNTVTWTVGFEDIAKPEKRLQTVMFSGEGLDWKPFGKQPAAEPAATPEEEKPAPEEEPKEEPKEEPEPAGAPGK